MAGWDPNPRPALARGAENLRAAAAQRDVMNPAGTGRFHDAGSADGSGVSWRFHPEAKDAYAQVKWEAAAVWRDDRIAYTEAKTEVILDLLDATQAWASANSPLDAVPEAYHNLAAVWWGAVAPSSFVSSWTRW